MNNFPIYLLSNGSTESYKDNTLTSFKNRFPIKFETKKGRKYQIAVQSVGISQNYNNCLSIDNANAFHILSFRKNTETTQLPINPINKCINLTSVKNDTSVVKSLHKILFPKGRRLTASNFKVEFDKLNKIYSEVLNHEENYFSLSNDNTLLIKNNSDKTLFVCFHETAMVMFGILKQTDLKKLPETMEIDITNENLFSFKNESFNLSLKNIQKFYREENNKLILNYQPIHTSLEFVGDFYTCFKITKKRSSWIYGSRNVLEKYIPKVIKIQCFNIEEQIFDNGYSRDLFCFCPIIPKENDEMYNYYYQEFKSKEFINFDNTILEKLQIKIVDQDNRPVELLSDITTLVHLVVREMYDYDSTINLRLTSKPRTNFEDNQPYKFRVKLPQPIITDRNWKIALTSISYPAKYSTFPPNDKVKSIIIHGYRRNNYGGKLELVKEKTLNLLSDISYSKDSLFKTIDTFLREEEFGVLKQVLTSHYDEECYNFFFTCKDYEELIIYVSKALLQIIGYGPYINYRKNYRYNNDSCIILSSQTYTYKAADGHFYESVVLDNENFYPFHLTNERNQVVSINNPLTYGKQSIYRMATTFNKIGGAGIFDTQIVAPFKFGEINLSYFIPKYLMIYADFINPSLMGGNLLKILKIIPVSESPNNYVLYEIENKEYLELQNNILDTLQFEIRGHDGNLINFVTSYDVLLNLELTNNPNR